MAPASALTPATLHILLALAEENAHGYGIRKAVERLTDGAISLGSGTLYEAMQRLLHEGWIDEVASAPVGSKGAPRRVYRITRSGRRVMRHELDRLAGIVDHARARHFIAEAENAS